MVKKLNNCLLLFVVLLISTSGVNHPIFMSVTEIEHNTKDKTLEISCKMFTNDLENQLKKSTKQKVDLLNTTLKPKMNGIVEDYIQSHLKIAINDNPSSKMKFIGFEQHEDAIVSYFEIDDVASIKAFGLEVVTDLCDQLRVAGAPGLHFYSLNQAEPTIQIARNLGI